MFQKIPPPANNIYLLFTDKVACETTLNSFIRFLSVFHYSCASRYFTAFPVLWAYSISDRVLLPIYPPTLITKISPAISIFRLCIASFLKCCNFIQFLFSNAALLVVKNIVGSSKFHSWFPSHTSSYRAKLLSDILPFSPNFLQSMRDDYIN